jgi:MSHA pilin protein MshA
MAGLTGIFNPTQAQLEAEGYTYGAGGSVATFGVIGSTDPNNCFFTYTQPAAANSAAIISGLTVSGC